MHKKLLRRITFADGTLSIIMAYLLFLPVFWILAWVADELRVTMTFVAAASIVAFSIGLSNCLVSKFPFFGLGFAVCESLGITLSLSTFNFPQPPQLVLLVWLGLGTVSHLTGLIRIARLKSLGYTMENQVAV